MLEITEEIVRKQEDFLRRGPLYLKKLTRKQVAEAIGVHPSTVSRALAVRYCWLPDNSILSFNVFFNPAACYIEMIRQILKDESPDKVYSDEEIRDIMAERGHKLSRRVITKYRKKGKIPPSGRRRRFLAREWKKRKAKLATDTGEIPDDLELEDIEEPDEDFDSDENLEPEDDEDEDDDSDIDDETDESDEETEIPSQESDGEPEIDTSLPTAGT
jgi:hypothetical protein